MKVHAKFYLDLSRFISQVNNCRLCFKFYSVLKLTHSIWHCCNMHQIYCSTVMICSWVNHILSLVLDALTSSLMLLVWVLSLFLIIWGKLVLEPLVFFVFQSGNAYILNNKGFLKPDQINLQKLKRQNLHYGRSKFK